jgi:hypothetical protein
MLVRDQYVFDQLTEDVFELGTTANFYGDYYGNYVWLFEGGKIHCTPARLPDTSA